MNRSESVKHFNFDFNFFSIKLTDRSDLSWTMNISQLVCTLLHRSCYVLRCSHAQAYCLCPPMSSSCSLDDGIHCHAITRRTGNVYGRFSSHRLHPTSAGLEAKLHHSSIMRGGEGKEAEDGQLQSHSSSSLSASVSPFHASTSKARLMETTRDGVRGPGRGRGSMTGVGPSLTWSRHRRGKRRAHAGGHHAAKPRAVAPAHAGPSRRCVPYLPLLATHRSCVRIRTIW